MSEITAVWIDEAAVIPKDQIDAALWCATAHVGGSFRAAFLAGASPLAVSAGIAHKFHELDMQTLALRSGFALGILDRFGNVQQRAP